MITLSYHVTHRRESLTIVYLADVIQEFAIFRHVETLFMTFKTEWNE